MESSRIWIDEKASYMVLVNKMMIERPQTSYTMYFPNGVLNGIRDGIPASSVSMCDGTGRLGLASTVWSARSGRPGLVGAV